MWRCSSQPPVHYPCTSRPVRTQDHPHPVAGCAPPPTRRCRIASKKCEEPSRGDAGLVCRRSSSRGQFPGYSLVRLSHTAIVAAVHCNSSDQFVVNTFVMSMNSEARSILSGPLALSQERGESIALGQVAMATDRGSRRTALTGNAGIPIGGRPSGTRKEAVMETWIVRPLYGARPGVGKTSEGGETGAHLSSLTEVQGTTLSTASYSTPLGRWPRQFRWFILGPMNQSKLQKDMVDCLKVESCEDWLFWEVERKLHTLLCWTVIYIVIAVHLPYTF